MADLVECVTSAIFEAMDVTDGLDGAAAERYARAATIALLEYTRDHVTNEMIGAGWGQLKRAHLPRLGAGPGVSDAFRAMIDALLKEIGGET